MALLGREPTGWMTSTRQEVAVVGIAAAMLAVMILMVAGMTLVRQHQDYLRVRIGAPTLTVSVAFGGCMLARWAFGGFVQKNMIALTLTRCRGLVLCSGGHLLDVESSIVDM